MVNCWNKYIPRNRMRRATGSSAGSLIAAYYLMDLPLDTCLKGIIEMTEDIRRRPLGVFDRSNQMVDILPRLLDKLLPDDAHERVNGRLFVCMTRLRDMKSVTVSEFHSKQDLLDALNCSCFIPVWSGDHVSTFRGVKHIDGGVTNNLPAFDEHTIRISPFSGPMDIAPYDRAHSEMFRGNFQGMPFYLNWKNTVRAKRALWPPPPSYITQLLERGFHDAKQFILDNDLIQCNKCFGRLEQAHQPIYTRLKRPNGSRRASPAISRATSFIDLARLEAGQERASGPVEARARSHSTSSSDEATNLSGADSPNTSASSGVSSNSTKQDSDLGGRSFGASLQARLISLVNSSKPARAKKEEAEEKNSEAPLACPTIVIQDEDSSAEKEEASPIVSETQVHKLMRAGARQRRGSLPPSLNKTTGSPLDSFVRRMSTTPEALECAESSESTPLGQGTSLLADKFAMAPSPLPSCPPSPRLNRHCDECLLLRQQARVDLISEQIREQAELYRSPSPAGPDPEKKFASLAAGGGFKAKMTRWMRSLSGQSRRQTYALDCADSGQPNGIPTTS